MYSSISRDDLIIKLNIKHHKKNTRSYLCTKCGSTYSQLSGLSRHKKKCNSTSSNTSNEILQQQINELQNKIHELESRPIQQHITNNINNTINNNTFNIVKNNFGHEKIDHLFNHDEYMIRCLEKFVEDDNPIVNLIENIYCDFEHPENHTVRLRNATHGIMETFDNNKWIQIQQDELLKLLINKGYTIFREYAKKNKYNILENFEDSEYDQDNYNDVVKFLTSYCVDHELKKHKKNLIVLFRNNKLLVLTQF